MSEKFPSSIQNYVQTLKDMPLEELALTIARTVEKDLQKGLSVEETGKILASKILEAHRIKPDDYPEETYKKFQKYMYFFVKAVA